MARIVLGPVSISPHSGLWILWAAAALVTYFGASIWIVWPILTGDSQKDENLRKDLWRACAPFAAALLVQVAVLQLRPDIGRWPWNFFSPIEPFPTVGMAIGILLIIFLRLLAVGRLAKLHSTPISYAYERTSNLAVPIALLLVGVMQASVYITPIGNAFLRFWAIADGITQGAGYPVTLTEPGPVAAGSPPYVYDLPLLPLMLRLAFTLLGHNSAAAHLPAMIWGALFPWALYLLIHQATRSRTTGLVFTMMAVLFPYLRFWVVNLPDPDPVLLTVACLAAYSYLRALDAPHRSIEWLAAGMASGALSLARPEGILYAGCIGLGILLSRPKMKQLALYLLCVGCFVVPMMAVWLANFGFLWPENYNRTLSLEYPLQNLEILQRTGALTFYHRGLGLDEGWALGLLVFFSLSVLLGMVLMTARNRFLLAMAVPGIGNTITIFFAHPAIPNTYHFADFFRHDSFGIPFLVLTSAYAFHQARGYLAKWKQGKAMAGFAVLVIVAIVVREGDILANPTATHRIGATQVLTDYPHLSLQAILEHPMPLPQMTFYQEDSHLIAYPASMAWPDDALAFFKPLDMSTDNQARPFGYASIVLFLIALGFSLLAEAHRSPSSAESLAPLKRTDAQ